MPSKEVIDQEKVVINEKMKIYIKNTASKAKNPRAVKEEYDPCTMDHKIIDPGDGTHISDMKFLDGPFLLILQSTGTF